MKREATQLQRVVGLGSLGFAPLPLNLIKVIKGQNAQFPRKNQSESNLIKVNQSDRSPEMLETYFNPIEGVPDFSVSASIDVQIYP